MSTLKEDMNRIFEGSPNSIIGSFNDCYIVGFGKGDDIAPLIYINPKKKTADLTLFAGHGWRMQRLFDYLKENNFSIREYISSQ